MRIRYAIPALVCACALVACGERKRAPSAGAGQPAQQPPAAAPAGTTPEPAAPAARTAELQAKEAELAARVQQCERAIAELSGAQEKDLAKFGEFSRVRRRYVTLVRDARMQKGKLDSLTSRLAELEKTVQAEAKGKLAELRDARADVEREYDDAVSFRKEQQSGAAAGRIEESPVKKDLDMLRAMKLKWFEITAAARRSRLDTSASRMVSDGFRAWLREEPRRGELAKQVLGQPVAPKGLSPDGYDFTDLDFYILMELLENELDKQNIAVERRELGELGKKVRALQEKLDSMDEEIAGLMNDQGGDLAEYEDLRAREKTLRSVFMHLEGEVAEYSGLVEQYQEMRERHARESNEASDALEKARAELAAVRNELRAAR